MRVSSGGNINIISPNDWQPLTMSIVMVVVSGPLAGNETCGLARRDCDNVGAISSNDMVAVAKLQRAGPALFFSCVPVYDLTPGAYYILLIGSGDIILTASGVILNRPGVTEFRFSPRTSCAPHPVWPLEFVHSQVSTFPVPNRKLTPAIVEEVAPGDLLHRDLAARPPVVAVLERPEAFDANGSVLHDLCLGTDLPEYKALQTQMTWNSPFFYLARFDNAIADVREGVVLYGGNQIWGDSTIAPFTANPDISRFNQWFETEGQIGWLDQYSETEPLERPVMLFCHWASQRNHAHWLMNSLISIYHVLPQLQSGSLSLLCHRVEHQHRVTLAKLGVPASAILETDVPFVRCKTLIFPSPLSTAANIYPSGGICGYFETLKSCFKVRFMSAPPERVYFTRRGFQSGRTISNEAELISVLHAHGFVCIAPHELTLEEEIYVLSGAKIIVGQLGAALTNLGFAPSGAVIVELGTDNYTSNEYCRMASLLGQKYVRLMVKPDSEMFISNHQFKFSASIPAILKVIERL